MIKILVAVKRVIDPYVKVRVKADHSGVETQQVKMSMNPFDEIAMEEAIRLQEKNIASEVVAVTIGADSSQETLRHALALGANRAILIRSNLSFCALTMAKLLQKIIQNEAPRLVLMGKQSIDTDNNQTPQMLAALLDWPQATFVSKLEVEGNAIQATREIDGGLETLSMPLPAVVSTDLRLNTPRYASLPNIMKSKQKPLTVIEWDSLGVEFVKHVDVLEVRPPTPRQSGIKVNTVEALIDKLKHEAKVL